MSRHGPRVCMRLFVSFFFFVGTSTSSVVVAGRGENSSENAEMSGRAAARLPFRRGGREPGALMRMCVVRAWWAVVEGHMT